MRGAVFFIFAGWTWAQNCEAVWVNPQPGGEAITAIAKFNGLYVAGLYDGKTLVSNDFVVWAPNDTPTTKTINKLAIGDNLLVGVTNSSKAITSVDGMNWDVHTIAGPTANYYDVIYANNQYVAVGGSGSIVTSPDAITWTPQISGTTESLWGVGFYENIYFACGGNGTILSSPDAITWTLEPSGVTQSLNTVCGDGVGNVYVAGYSGKILLRNNGTWNLVPGVNSGIGIIDLVYTGAEFLGFTQSLGVVHSADGLQWTTNSLTYNLNLTSLFLTVQKQ